MLGYILPVIFFGVLFIGCPLAALYTDPAELGTDVPRIAVSIGTLVFWAIGCVMMMKIF